MSTPIDGNNKTTSPNETIEVTTEANKYETEPKEEDIANLGGLSRISKDYGNKFCGMLLFAYFITFANGCVFPFFAIVFRTILDTLTQGDIVEGAKKNLAYFIGVGLGALVFTLGQYYAWSYYGTKVTAIIRQEYFEVLLRQEVGFHEATTSGNLNQRMSTECAAIQEGISTKLGFALQQFSSFVFGTALAFYYSWEMTLVLLACVPALVLVGAIQGKMLSGSSGINVDPFVKGGSFSQEVLTNVRVVISFPSLVKYKYRQYCEVLDEALPKAKRKHVIIGAGLGAFFFGLFGVNYAIGLWYGGTLVDKHKIDIGEMFGCFFGFMIAGMALGQVGSVAGDIAKAKLAANKFFWLKARIPIIKPPTKPDSILKPTKKLEGSIEFNHVEFSYPTDLKSTVLNDVSFKVSPGKTIAIVGPSGSGKSTIISLLERFYDPTRGEIYIDNQRINDYDIEYLRSNIGLVNQMPLLFDVSIKENIRGGKKDISDEQIYEAAKHAYAHDFILKLPNGYDTQVGELGGRLSGGQRQRIAIARAIVGSPSILLLDEATSALDSQSEREVQMALDSIQSTNKHTIIVVAHRLSTIQNADEIIVLVAGDIEEQGNHQSLLQNKGLYSILVESQKLLEAKKMKSASDDQNVELLSLQKSQSTGSTTGQ